MNRQGFLAAVDRARLAGHVRLADDDDPPMLNWPLGPPANRKDRRFSGLLVGSDPIPIFPGLARQLVPTGADLRRLNAGTHPILMNHTAAYAEQIGRVLSAEPGRAGVRGEVEIFGSAPEGIHRMLDAGMRNVSLGFKPLKNEEVDTEMGLLIRSTLWEGDEVSLVAIGASRVARLDKELTNAA